MKQLWIAISIITAFLAGCDGADDSAFLVLDERGLATIHSPRNDDPSTASGPYKIESSREDHRITVDTKCGQLQFIYKRASGLRFVDDEQSNSAAYQCGFGTQSSSAQWKVALKPLTGPSLPPTADWPR
ncbi:hypothetical protein [Pseudomonas sp. NPDC096950]|uniref:hypothetical protein n=1 Tax=Pseudomonas sp. NPDC096950 TaxID=3364485 RepID=UPI00383AF86B